MSAQTSLIAGSRGYSLVEVSRLHCRGFSCFGAQPLGHTGLYRVVGTRALLLQGMWDLPSLGINKLMSPALADDLLTSETSNFGEFLKSPVLFTKIP